MRHLTLCSHIFLVLGNHGVYTYVVYIWKWSSAHVWTIVKAIKHMRTFFSIDCMVSILMTLKMLCLYLLGQNCLHLTFKPYLSSETYSRQYEKLPSIVVYACTLLHKKCICWKCLARKFGFVCLRFDPLRRNS